MIFRDDDSLITSGLTESSVGKPVLFVPVSRPISFSEAFAEVRYFSRSIRDNKNPETMIRTGGFVEELLHVPQYQAKGIDDVVEADIIWGNVTVHPAGFHLKRSFTGQKQGWQLEISHPDLAHTRIFGERIMVVRGKKQPDLTFIFKLLDDVSADGAVILPEQTDIEIANFQDVKHGSYKFPLLDIDDSGHLQWLLPIYCEPLEIKFYIHPGLDSVL